ncbi:MAG: retropepsin-like domain-containing protein [Sedimentisphaerales bacterium]|nr:retropepsin-like domain-containing protein [Sedimentisphaerales bacterium]
MPEIRSWDPNNGIFEIISREPNRVNIKWEKTDIYLKDSCRVKMRENSQGVEVLGQINNRKSYPVRIDTGATGYLAVTDSLVPDADLEIYPVDDIGRNVGGLCLIKKLKLGTLTIVHPACVYWLAHYERRVLGYTTWQEKKINLGLGLLREFSYILIDNVTREVEFAVKNPFNPQDSNQWHQYPMVTGDDEKQSSRLKLDIPLAGESRRIELDTGADSGLVLTEKMWAEISTGLQLLDEEQSQLATPLFGLLSCRKITVERFDVGNISINNAQVSIIANDTPYGHENFVLGMDFFIETVIVLDFKRNTLWIRNPES